MNALSIRTMRAGEVGLAIDWAAREGWNPGLHDAASFYAADADGFLIGEVDGRPAAVISAVQYGDDFGFIGLYIVAPAMRGRGYGLAIWRAAMARLAGRNIGLDGVVAQQENYRKSGFRFAYNNARYAGVGGGDLSRHPRSPRLTERGGDGGGDRGGDGGDGDGDLPRHPRSLLSGGGDGGDGDGVTVAELSSARFADIAAYDRRFFPAERDAFLRAWLAQPGAAALGVHSDGGELAGYGVIRSCREGHKIGPLFADSPAIARALFDALAARASPGAPVFLDIPECNPDARALAESRGMRKVFETARMYTGDFPDLPLDNLFGVTTFELG